MQLTRMAYDAEMPLVRPDTYAIAMAGELWGIFTPSTTVLGCLSMGTEAECKAEMEKVGVLVGYPSERTPGTNWKYTIEGPLKDAEWWKARGEDGMLVGLDLSKWGIEIKEAR